MKIAYILHWDLFREDGVTKKVRTQIKYWQQMACVKVFAYMPPPATPDATLKVEAECFIYRSLQQRIKATQQLAKAVRAWEPDVIYFRYNPPYAHFFSLFKNIPTVFELNTDDVQQYRLGSKPREYYNVLARRIVFKHAVGVVSVSNEIAQLPYVSGYHKPTIVLGNAIDLVQYKPLPAAPQKHPRLIFLGSEQTRWHGVEKLVWLAQYWPECHIDLVGEYPELKKQPLPNLHIHGFLDRKEYEPLMIHADVAIGSLALHYNNMNEASPLKVREYLAYGLPVIIGYQDTDFMESTRFILQLPNTVDNVKTHLEQIKHFVQTMRGYRVSRKFVATQIDAAVKEPKRIEFIRDIVSQAQVNNT